MARHIDKSDKPQANYRESSGQNCGNCSFMHDDGSCALVQGTVTPEMVCDFWTAP